MRFLSCLPCLWIITVIAFTSCASKYYEDTPPLINKTDLEPGLYRIVINGYSYNTGKIEWVETFIPAELVPECQRIIVFRQTIFCESHRIRIILNPQPLSTTDGKEHFSKDLNVLRLGSIEIVVRITKGLGTKIQKENGYYDVTYYEYEGIPIRNLKYRDMLFEFEESKE